MLTEKRTLARRVWTVRYPLISALVLAIAVLSAVQSDSSATAQDDAAGPMVLITGANRGLGLEFARQYQAAGYRVIGTARKPEEAKELNALGVRVEQLDVADPKSVAALQSRLSKAPIDILINNAGISGGGGSIAKADLAAIERVLQVNTVGPIRVTQALLPNLQLGGKKIVVSISSGLGSIANNRRGGNYGYRESKAALNMFMRSLAAELKDDGFRCIAMSPGWVRTDMGGSQAPLSPADSIGGMIKVIDSLTKENSGEFFNHDGKKVPW